ncbi:MAG: amidoligase family protein [Roseinatronobacter sp.]
MLHDEIPRARFWPLPDHLGKPSANRLTGLEIEFAGLGVIETARLVATLWGGLLHADDAKPARVIGGRFGTVKVELDISLGQAWLDALATRALGDVVPVEIVTDPLPQSALPAVGALLDALARAGGQGTQERLGFGFGIHLNPGLPDDHAATLRIACAFGLLEDWLRRSAPIDPTRRVLPFVAPWPPALVDALVDALSASLNTGPPVGRPGPDALAAIYATLAPSRNFGLDLLPALQHLAPDQLRAVPDGHLKGARPTFHYRLPETRLGDPDWSLAFEWNRWVLVEAVAADTGLLATLGQGWTACRAAMLRGRRDWATEVEQRLRDADLLARQEAP